MSLFLGILSNMRGGRKAVSRSSQRFTVLTPAGVRAERAGAEWTDCMLENVSGGGACIQARLDLKRGEHVDLRLKLGIGDDVSMRARVVYTSAGAPGSLSNSGLRFTDLTYPDCQALTAYLTTRETTQRHS